MLWCVVCCCLWRCWRMFLMGARLIFTFRTLTVRRRITSYCFLRWWMWWEKWFGWRICLVWVLEKWKLSIMGCCFVCVWCWILFKISIADKRVISDRRKFFFCSMSYFWCLLVIKWLLMMLLFLCCKMLWWICYNWRWKLYWCLMTVKLKCKYSIGWKRDGVWVLLMLWCVLIYFECICLRW